MKKINTILKIIVVIGGILLLLSVIFKDKIYRLQFSLSMFSGEEQVERFRQVSNYFPVKKLQPSANPSEFLRGQKVDLPSSFPYNNGSQSIVSFLEETDTTGLLIIKNDSLVFEEYYNGNTDKSLTIGWSVTKSFVSALLGIALEEGYIKTINDVVSDYVPELKGSAYENITIKNLLQMSSGVSWDEDYSDFNSDINRFGRTLALGGSFDKFAQSLKKDKEQGVYNRYNSVDTQVLGMLISRATKKSLATYLEEKIWKPLGMENEGHWVVDDYGDEFAAGGLCVSLRDYARMGQLYLKKGLWKGKQLVPEKWVQQSLTPDAPHLLPGDNPNSSEHFGYGFQWWILNGDEKEFCAIGIYNQFIYVNPTRDILIVKTSASSNYGLTDDETSERELESIEFFREIARSLSPSS